MPNNRLAPLALIGTVVACSADPASSSAESGGAGTSGVAGMLGAGATLGTGGGGAPGGGGLLGGGGGLPPGGGGAFPGGSGPIGGAGATAMPGMTGGGGGISAGGSATGGAGGGSAGGTGGSPAPICKSTAPADFQPNTTAGGGGTVLKDSARFRIYGSAPLATADTTLKHLEAAYSCFVDDWCFRSTGLVVQQGDSGPYYKTNIYASANLGSAAGLTSLDFTAGLPYIQAISSQMDQPCVTVHEWGHAIAISEYYWVDQKATGAWWETMANWLADTYMTSSYCEPARSRAGIAAGNTLIDLNRVIGQSYLLIVSTQNYYEAWPFLTYLTMNPDNYAGLGRLAVQDLMRKHPRNNETPLHVLQTMAAPVKVQAILGRYWAHMAYLDIGHPKAQAAFFSARGSLNFANLDSMGGGSYQVKAARKPQYGGANIIPLKGTGNVTVQVKNLGNGQAGSNFTATLSIRATDGGSVRYVDLPNGSGEASVASNEESSLVVANTPDALIQYDAFATTASSPESMGLNYQVQITGASP